MSFYCTAPKVSRSALFRLLPPASLLVGHDGLNAIVIRIIIQQFDTWYPVVSRCLFLFSRFEFRIDLYLFVHKCTVWFDFC